ncbi:MAG: adenylate/guanylate cyclase domain-containing protein [Ignavibacteria bacterium]|nr:adenylate/guanylate cyclase domain-containing protein [Ignavibacteria bacterium]
MKTIPSGNITFLFTDIEGSTKLSQKFPETIQNELEKHHSILKKTVESNRGFIFEIVGDAFCCAFENAENAVMAAVAAQLELACEKWNDVKIKVRMGIHSGDVEWNGNNYIGYITLASTARITSAAYGEQILISGSVFNLLNRDNTFRKKISFRDLGERRLKDLINPLRIYQVLSDGLRKDFPPLKTPDARPNNLPVQLTDFIGRKEELEQIKNLLRVSHLITITGMGGTGKTRLALQAGFDVIDDFENGVWLAELAALSETSLLAETIIKIFGLMEGPNKSQEDTLCDFLKNKELLLILDNCEHLVQNCADLAEKLLISCPRLRIITTSREALKCRGEQLFPVLGMRVPPNAEMTPEKIIEYESVKLFIERATSVNPKFSICKDNIVVLAGICSQLDGIPLAIELAAAKIKFLSVEKIYERLDDRFNLLTKGNRTSLPRQQTLRALIDWSHDLLSEQERILWRRTSVFTGGWTLDAAEVICPDETLAKKNVLDLLSQLIEKSIVIFDEDNERYKMPETIRQYGVEKFTKSENREITEKKYLKYYMELAETAEPKLKSSEMEIWMRKLDSENGNLKNHYTSRWNTVNMKVE